LCRINFIFFISFKRSLIQNPQQRSTAKELKELIDVIIEVLICEKFKKKEISLYFRKGSASISPAADNNLPNNSHKTREEIERQKLEEEDEEEMNNELAKVTLAPTRDDVNLN
jgi:hypothetical protein